MNFMKHGALVVLIFRLLFTLSLVRAETSVQAPEPSPTPTESQDASLQEDESVENIAVAEFGSKPSEESGLIWQSGPFKVVPRFVNNKAERVVVLKGILVGRDVGLVSNRADKDLVQLAPASEDFTFPTGKTKEEVQEVTAWIALDGPTTEVHFQIVDAHGKSTQQEVVLVGRTKLKQVLEKRVSLANISGYFTETKSSGSTTTTSSIGNIYELSGMLSYYQYRRKNSRMFEFSLGGSVGYMLASSGVTFPLFWGGIGQVALKNLFTLGANKTWIGNPLLAVQGEGLAMGSPLLVTTADGTSYQTRSLTHIWVGLGCRFRYDSLVRWWEITPSFAYSPYSRSMLSVTSSTLEAHQGWKFGLKVNALIWKKLYGGLEGNYRTLTGDTAISSLTAALSVGARF